MACFETSRCCLHYFDRPTTKQFLFTMLLLSHKNINRFYADKKSMHIKKARTPILAFQFFVVCLFRLAGFRFC